MTKSDKIRATAKKHPSWSTKEIGEACDCSDAYVRVALRQRVGGQMSDIDRRWEAKFKAENGITKTAHRRRRDPEFRKRLDERARQWAADNPERIRELRLASYYRHHQLNLERQRAYRARQKAEREGVSA
jgi:hypothetical protein